LNLAFGAWGLGNLKLATEYAEHGLKIAEQCGDRYDIDVGQRLLVDLKNGTPAPAPIPLTDTEQRAELEQLSALVTENLVSWHGGTWTRKEGDQLGPDDIGPV
jgi:hypothetical protein